MLNENLRRALLQIWKNFHWNVCANRLVNGSMKNRAFWSLISFLELWSYLCTYAVGKSFKQMSTHTQKKATREVGGTKWNTWYIPCVMTATCGYSERVFIYTSFTDAARVIYSTRIIYIDIWYFRNFNTSFLYVWKWKAISKQ
jgi:hypothetical protein